MLLNLFMEDKLFGIFKSLKNFCEEAMAICQGGESERLQVGDKKRIVKYEKRKRKHHKEDNDPDKPKKPFSAYLLFSMKQRETDEAKKVHPKKMMKYLSDKWKELNQESKDKWIAKYHTQLKEYQETFQAYEKSKKKKEKNLELEKQSDIKEEDKPKKQKQTDSISEGKESDSKISEIKKSKKAISKKYIEMKDDDSENEDEDEERKEEDGKGKIIKKEDKKVEKSDDENDCKNN